MPPWPRHADRERSSPARRCAYAVLRARVRARRLRRRGARAPQAQELDARDRALAMRLAYGAVQRRAHARPPDRARSPNAPPARIDPPLLAALRLGLYELLLPAAARPTTRPSPTPSSSPRREPAPATASSTPCCAGPRARAAALLGALARRHARAGRRSSTRTRSGSRGCGGSSSAPSGARALMAADNEPGELALRANTLVTDARRARWRALPVASAPRPATCPRRVVLDGALRRCTARRCGRRGR